MYLCFLIFYSFASLVSVSYCCVSLFSGFFLLLCIFVFCFYCCVSLFSDFFTVLYLCFLAFDYWVFVCFFYYCVSSFSGFVYLSFLEFNCCVY